MLMVLKAEIIEYDEPLQIHVDVLNDCIRGIKPENLVKIYMNNNKDILLVWNDEKQSAITEA